MRKAILIAVGFLVALLMLAPANIGQGATAMDMDTDTEQIATSGETLPVTEAANTHPGSYTVALTIWRTLTTNAMPVVGSTTNTMSLGEFDTNGATSPQHPANEVASNTEDVAMVMARARSGPNWIPTNAASTIEA